MQSILSGSAGTARGQELSAESCTDSSMSGTWRLSVRSRLSLLLLPLPGLKAGAGRLQLEQDVIPVAGL